MKKIILFALIAISLSGFSQTATNFNLNDCSGTNHNLFAELDAGKVVVIAWPMPCGSCIAPCVSAYTEVQNYTSTYPGRVLYYLVDDYGNTTCTTLTNWGNTNGITGVPVFSNAAISMSDYGTNGMPKIVVLGGPTHDVLFNQNNGLNVTNFNNAIMAGLTTGISANVKGDFKLNLFPNPSSTNKTTVSYSLTQSSEVNFEIYNTLGAKVKSVSFEKQALGKHEAILDFETLPNGVYFIKLNAGDSSQLLKFTINH